MEAGKYAHTGCAGSRHGGTQEAYRHGCRHPLAIAAHERWQEERKAECPGCPSRIHHSGRAWKSGCRSPLSVAAHEHTVGREREYDARRRAKDKERLGKRDAAHRLTGGALQGDPRARWRSGRMAVDRNNLRQFLAGFPDSPTTGEVIAAIAKLEGKLVPDSAYLSRLITPSEIAAKLKLGSDRQVYRSWVTRKRLRDQRTLRRLADVQWKTALAPVAASRKDRVRLEHEAAHERAAARRLAWKWHCRTMRRLRESQERAKVVALAIERRALCITR